MTAPTPPDSPFLSHLYQHSLDCVHCGLCLPVCPTYQITGRESSSPRGRIYLLRGVAEGKIPLEGAVAEEAYACLGCRACESACPSGVRFGSLIELGRAEVERQTLRRGPAKRVERFALRSILPRPRRLHALLSLLRGVQLLGIDRLMAPFLPRRLRMLQESAPRVPGREQRRRLPGSIPARGVRRGRVGLFVGCVMPELFGDVNAATARVLAHNGFDVVVPEAQGCCGALHLHAGDPEFATDLTQANARAFEAADVDAVIVNSAGCGAALREPGPWIPESARSLSASIRDVSEFLDDVGLRAPEQERKLRVCYDDPCHLIHGQGVAAAPRRLLEAIPGVTLVPHESPGDCCGAAGIYNLTHPTLSRQVLERKLDSLAKVDPDVIATGNPGCILQLRVGVRDRGLRAQVLHPVELLDSAYGAASIDR